MATISFGGKAINTSSTGSSVVIDKPAALVEGDLLVALLSGGRGLASPLGAPAGFTPLIDEFVSGISAGGSLRAWVKEATASEPANYAFTAGGDGGRLAVQFIVVSGASGLADAGTVATGFMDQTGTQPRSLAAPSVPIPPGADKLLSLWFCDHGYDDALYPLSGPTGATRLPMAGTSADWGSNGNTRAANCAAYLNLEGEEGVTEEQTWEGDVSWAFDDVRFSAFNIVVLGEGAESGSSISNVTPDPISQTSNVTITGTGFGATQGTGRVVLSPQNDITAFAAEDQAITSWSDTEIVTNGVVIPFGTSTSAPLHLFVENDSAEVNAPSYQVSVTFGASISEGTFVNQTTDGFQVRFTTDTASGTAYYVVYNQGMGIPTEDKIRNGLDSSNQPALAADSMEISTTGEQTFPAVTGLDPGTTYRVAVVHYTMPV